MNKSRKILSTVAAAALAFSTLSLAACGEVKYKGDDVKTKDATAVVAGTNGGFSVETEDFVYFINGRAENTADNTYGDVVKGSLMRISKADLAAGKNDSALCVVPSLFVTGNYDSGVYIYDGYVYYATPTTDKDSDGNVANTSLDFKRAKLDGTEAPMGGKNDYFFRLSSNSVKYRYVQVKDTVYCLYEDSSALKSYNTKTGETTILVEGAGTFYYDTTDLTNPNVYYTMSVTYDIDQTNTTAAQYNQVFSVNAAASAKTDAAKASYTVYDEDKKEIAKYDFDEKALQAAADEKKEADEEVEYDASKYATYPYVNLGKLVLDGVGASQDFPEYRVDVTETSPKNVEQFGYTYTLQGYKNGGLYYTRAAGTGSTTSYLYYLSDTRADANAITDNEKADSNIVSKDTATASATALFTVNSEGKHAYYYISGTDLIKTKEDGTTVTLNKEIASGSTLWRIEGEYLYYYGTGTNGKNLSRIKHDGAQEDYEFLGTDDYDPVTLALVDWSDSWYKPEIVSAGSTKILLYPNAQSYGAGGTAYNYIYATDLSKVDVNVENAEKIQEEIDKYKDNSQLQDLMKYYYRTGSTEAYEAVEDAELYSEYQDKEFKAFVAKFASGGEFSGMLEQDAVFHVGAMDEDDAEAIAESWADSLLSKEEEAEDETLPTYAIVLIVVGIVLAVGAAIIVPVVIVVKKKKAKAKKEAAIVNAYKHKKIDTTDDKSINVYEDETAKEEVKEEEAEAPTEE